MQKVFLRPDDCSDLLSDPKEPSFECNFNIIETKNLNKFYENHIKMWLLTCTKGGLFSRSLGPSFDSMETSFKFDLDFIETNTLNIF